MTPRGRLTVVETDHVPEISGEEVMRDIGEIIDRKLPSVPLDDPFRQSLLTLRSAVGTRRPR